MAAWCLLSLYFYKVHSPTPWPCIKFIEEPCILSSQSYQKFLEDVWYLVILVEVVSYLWVIRSVSLVTLAVPYYWDQHALPRYQSIPFPTILPLFLIHWCQILEVLSAFWGGLLFGGLGLLMLSLLWIIGILCINLEGIRNGLLEFFYQFSLHIHHVT